MHFSAIIANVILIAEEFTDNFNIYIERHRYIYIYICAILTNRKNISADIVVPNNSLKLATCIAAQRNRGLTKKDFSFSLLPLSKGYRVKTAQEPHKTTEQSPPLATKASLNCISLNNF